MRHDPQPDDPDLETDRGECPHCNGDGCEPKYRVDVWNFEGDVVKTMRNATWEQVEELQAQYEGEPYEVVFEETA